MKKALRLALWLTVISAASLGFEALHAGMRSYNSDGAVFVGSVLVLTSLAVYLRILRPDHDRPAAPGRQGTAIPGSGGASRQ